MIDDSVRLPENWVERSLAVDPGGRDRAWGLAAQGIISRHREAALAIHEVSEHVLHATGLSELLGFRSEHWLGLIPSPAWSIATAWGERLGTKGYRPGCLWSAVQDIRAVDDELNILRCLSSVGMEPVERARQDGMPDWTMINRGEQVHVEVKSKGGPEEPYELLHGALAAMQLADGPGVLRRVEWEYDTPNNLVAGKVLTAKTNMHALISALPKMRRALAQFLESGQSTGDSRKLHEDDRVEITIQRYVGIARIACGFRSHGGPPFEIWVKPDEDHVWKYPPPFSHGGWGPQRIEPLAVSEVMSLLDRLLLRGEPERRGRQVAKAPARTLFVLKWRAPVFWDDALANHPEDIQRILDGLSQAANEYRRDAPIALWPESFTRTLVRVHLNRPAQELLGREHVEDVHRAEWARAHREAAERFGNLGAGHTQGGA